ncbi:MAG: TonB-dependent receptor [Bacteroidetes bacterium]|nr:TonB-dependent receptor [Bacteroidota bacterium]
MNTKYFIAILLVLINTTAYCQQKNYKTEKFIVAGNCQQCKDRIEQTLKNAGVHKANWNIETQLLTVSFDSIKLSKQIIQKKLAAIGHESQGYITTTAIYNKLPECCKYDRLKQFADTTYQKKIDTLPILIKDTVSKKIPDTTAKTVVKKDSTTKTEILNEVKVESKKFSSFIANTVNTNTLTITAKELSKAACCNLSESFETSPSIDVSYSDGVTGIKQIQLLGLSGNYTQLTTENVPEIRGLAGAFGLTFVPGPFVESIQVTKGVGSVANGFESIAGQINIEEKKADNTEKLFVNAYANNLGRLEASANLSSKITNNLNTSFLIHANGVSIKNDANNDGFLDVPLGNQFNIINRWKFENNKGLETQFIVKYLQDKRIAGELSFNENTDKLTTNKYGVGIDLNQVLLTGKIGYVFPNTKYKSIGLIVSSNQYTNHSFYGINDYTGNQNSFYGNLIFQSIINSTTHKYRLGMSLINENYEENFAINKYNRKETVYGIFGEYTFTPNDKFTAVGGIRLDKHNEYGNIITPRIHLKYNFTNNTILRVSAGSGFRTANIFAENNGFFASSRKYEIINTTSNYGYGLQPEKAWNYGFNLLQKFNLNHHQGFISIDVYRTSFVNQSVVDVDANPQKILFYNLNGKSYSNTIQAEINYEIIKKLDIRIAYKWLDVKNTYSNELLQKPLTASNKAFINVAYATKDNWLFDITTQWVGAKRLPMTHNNPVDKQMDNYSPSYIQIAAQITKEFDKKLSIYAGAENIANAIQDKLFIDAAQPFSKYFDASMIWGNVNGRIVYVGVRYQLLK